MNEYIKAELLVLVPVLYVIGEFVKLSAIKDKYIPLIVGGVGVILASLYIISIEGLTAASIFAGITQGVLCAGCAVYGDQIFKQIRK